MTFSDTSVIITIISLLENRKINEKQNSLCSFDSYRSGCASGRRPGPDGDGTGLRQGGKNAFVQHSPARGPQRRAADISAGREVLVPGPNAYRTRIRAGEPGRRVAACGRQLDGPGCRFPRGGSPQRAGGQIARWQAGGFHKGVQTLGAEYRNEKGNTVDDGRREGFRRRDRQRRLEAQ